jgi:hypothetical protein
MASSVLGTGTVTVSNITIPTTSEKPPTCNPRGSIAPKKIEEEYRRGHLCFYVDSLLDCCVPYTEETCSTVTHIHNKFSNPIIPLPPFSASISLTPELFVRIRIFHQQAKKSTKTLTFFFILWLLNIVFEDRCKCTSNKYRYGTGTVIRKKKLIFCWHFESH